MRSATEAVETMDEEYAARTDEGSRVTFRSFPLEVRQMVCKKYIESGNKDYAVPPCTCRNFEGTCIC
jgi:hypothetical protein